jgi:hypothetical protein
MNSGLEKGRRSFLKKRTKKLLPVTPGCFGFRAKRTEVFRFFFSKKKNLLS